MEDSQPLRRSTRNSVVLKNEELTPKKRKVSTPVKVEPSTPSRRTRASSATPKKNLIEVLNTPKKTLPVVNEEENPSTSTRTPVKKSKEISPKTPSRRRLVRESVSTPKSTKKSVETTEEINVTANRPLTRAKRKTMGGVQIAEVTNISESENVIRNKKDKSESVKSIKNKKDKTTAANIDDNTINSSDGKSNNKDDESSSAVVPRVVLSDIKKQPLKKANNTEKGEDIECGTFTSKSPVKAEDVAINSPRKVPDNCKSNTEASLKSDSEYIKLRTQEIAMDPANLISSVGNTDLNSIGNTEISSVEQMNSNSSINTNSVPDITVTSPQKVIALKDNNILSTSPQKVNDIQNIVTTSPQKTIDSKDNDVHSIVTTFTQTQEVIDSKDNNVKNIVTDSPQKVIDSKKFEVPNIVVTCPSPKKVPDSKDIDIPNIVITSPSPQKATDSKDNKNGPDSSSISEKNTSPSKDKTNSSIIVSAVEEKDINKPLNAETIKSVDVITEISDEPDEEKSIKLENEPSSSEKNNENSKFSIEQEIKVSENPQIKNNEKFSIEGMDENSKQIIQGDVGNGSPARPDFQNNDKNEIKLISPAGGKAIPGGVGDCPEKVDPLENGTCVSTDDVNEENSVETVMQVSSVEIMDTDAEKTDIENKDSNELNKTFDKVEPNKQISDSDECIVAKNGCASKSAESVSQVLIDKNNVSSIVTDVNEAVTKGDVASIENENDREANKLKSINSVDETFKMDSSSLTESSVEHKTEKVDASSVVKEPVMNAEITSVENEESEKDEKLIADETNTSSPNNTACLNKVISNELISTEGSPSKDKDKKESELDPEGEEIDVVNCSREEINESIKDAVLESVRPESSPDSVKNEIAAEQNAEIDGFGIVGRPCHIESCDSSSPVFYMKCDCDTSDDSGDSGIQNEDNVIIFKMSSQCKKHITVEENPLADMPEQGPALINQNLDLNGSMELLPQEGEAANQNSSKSESDSSDIVVILRNFDEKPEKSHENLSPGKSEGKADEKLSPGKLDVKISTKKSDLSSGSNVPSSVEDKTETIAENFSESLELSGGHKITGLDEILMSPKDFLNSDEESNLDCEKDSQSENGKESSSKKKPSEKSYKEKDSISSNTTPTNDHSSECSTTKVDEKQDGCNVNDKSAVGVVETVENVSKAILCDSKSEISSLDSEKTVEIKDICVDQEKKEISSQKYSEEKNKQSKSSSSNSSEDNQISENKIKSPSRDDILEKTNSLQSSNSIEENESETNLLDNVISSQTIGSPKVEVEKSFEDEKSTNESESNLEDSVKMSEWSEADDKKDIGTDPACVKKNTKNIKNRRKNVKTLDSETESSETESSESESSETESSEYDDDSDLSNSPPSNVATVGSSDGPLTGKDFIDFEAEEGEETSEDDSFIAPSGESSASGSPTFAMKLRKRKRILDNESSDSCSYLESVQRLFDSSKEILKDEMQQDCPVLDKKQKLEKVRTVNKKNKRPKSILKNKRTIVESEGNRNKIKTENKVTKEFSKTGIFFVSSVNQHFEEPKLNRNSSKRSSKLRMEQQNLEISEDDRVPKSDVDENMVDDAAHRGFVVSYDDSYLVSKKPKKAAISSELVNKKKKIKEGKNNKKAVKKSTNSESKGGNKNETVSPFVVTLILPYSMTVRSISCVLTDLGLSSISSITFPRPKVAIVEFSDKKSHEKILKLYGELKINNKPIYILEGCSLV
ncbi:unnamed protein product [Nezara viridula]|uniref:Uncharacterized protein n=1 Tax=Nezara viridula TaxID=85310 RepID=A0A9P0HKX7_NEZVI|nr:unnamed protein product [Nezara viridula]